MVFELAIVEDRGTYYLVTGTTKSSFDNLANREDKVLKLSYNSYQKCSEGLADNKTVTITKELSSDEVLPGEVTVTEDKIDDLEVYKKLAMQRINKKMTYSMAALSALDVLSFTVINTELIAEGIVITNNNREDKYIEIIETEDEVLIEKLEEYLILLDKVTKALEFNNMSTSYITKLKGATSQDEVDTIMNDFYESYDAKSN